MTPDQFRVLAVAAAKEGQLHLETASRLQSTHGFEHALPMHILANFFMSLSNVLEAASSADSRTVSERSRDNAEQLKAAAFKTGY